jgi:hypothetical protein
MDEVTVDAFVNRDEPIPVILRDPTDDLSDGAECDDRTQPERKRDRLRKGAAIMKESIRKAQGKPTEYGSSLQDRFIEKCAQPFTSDPSPDSY